MESDRISRQIIVGSARRERIASDVTKLDSGRKDISRVGQNLKARDQMIRQSKSAALEWRCSTVTAWNSRNCG